MQKAGNKPDCASTVCAAAGAEDIPKIMELMSGYKQDIGEEPLTQAQKVALGAAIETGRITFILAKRDGRAVGMCSVCETFSTFRCASGGLFEDFYVLPMFRGQGVAHRLVEAAFAHCRVRGIASLWVGCADSDVKMYERLGFRIPLGRLLTWNGS